MEVPYGCHYAAPACSRDARLPSSSFLLSRKKMEEHCNCDKDFFARLLWTQLL
jgi:hypothetical protein